MNNKYFAFCNGDTISKGTLNNADVADTLSFNKTGWWISNTLDSGTNGTIWDHVDISHKLDPNSFFRFTAFASNKLTVNIGGAETPTQEALKAIMEGDPSMISSDIRAVTFVNPHSAPMHMLKGRYLWFVVEAVPDNGKKLEISSLTIHYPYQTYLDALPECFGRNDNGQLASMLALYRAVFNNVDQQISEFDRQLDIDTADTAMLEKLQEWQGIKTGSLWGDDALREMVRRSSRLIRMKGTQTALAEMLEILLGHPADIDITGRSEFTVTVDYDDVPSGRHHSELIRLIKEFTPVGIQGRLVLRRNNSTTHDDTLLLSDDSFDSGMILSD